MNIVNHTKLSKLNFPKMDRKYRFCYDIKYLDDTLYSQEPVTFEKVFGDDDVAQIFIDTLEKNIKDIYTSLSSQKV